jgi:hypothetical protein
VPGYLEIRSLLPVHNSLRQRIQLSPDAQAKPPKAQAILCYVTLHALAPLWTSSIITLVTVAHMLLQPFKCLNTPSHCGSFGKCDICYATNFDVLVMLYISIFKKILFYYPFLIYELGLSKMSSKA